MKKIIARVLSLGMVLVGSLGLVCAPKTFADESGTSISLSPTSKIFQLASGSVYDSTFTVSNDGSSDIKIEVYAAPYSYVYSDEENLYQLGFNNETNFTQIVRWISFKDVNGNYTEKAFFTIKPASALEISYRVTTPSSIPSGGQYAVIFAHTLSDAVSTNAIRTEASPGMVVYGRSLEGETSVAAEISDLEIRRSITEPARAGKEATTRNSINALARIKNTGNVDFSAVGILKVQPIIGSGEYETPSDSGVGRLSVIPEAELILSDEWAETPTFGIYKATWTIVAAGRTEVVERIIFLIPTWVIILSIIFLTFVAIWIIIVVRKRKERRSRLAI
ncbi:hypothetical protein IKF73_01560 [Candidatus Saccharibacteria bacterium]|nr:hypothetical protein [Candidatus Saccharibacteria bacterium]